MLLGRVLIYCLMHRIRITEMIHPLQLHNTAWWDGKVMLFVYGNRLLATAGPSKSGFCLGTADKSDESRLAVACWFWQIGYIQSSYSAAFYRYVTTVRTRESTYKTSGSQRTQRAFWSPKSNPPHPSSSCLSFSWTAPILLSPLSRSISPVASISSLPILSSPPFWPHSLAPHPISSSPYLIHATPPSCFSFCLVLWVSESAISLPEPQLRPQTSHFWSVYSIIHFGLIPPPAQTATPPETHSRNAIDRTDKKNFSFPSSSSSNSSPSH